MVRERDNHQEEQNLQLDENDISIFRKVLPAAKESRGRSIAQVLYHRSTRGPRGVGGVKKVRDKHSPSALAHASPSSVILPTPGSNSSGDGDGDQHDETDSLSEILGGDSHAPSANGIAGSARDALPGMLDNNINSQSHSRNQNQEPSTPVPVGPASPTRRAPFPMNGNRIHNPNNEVPSIRQKMNAYPTNISTEINNFAEQCAVHKFNTDYLSLDKIKPPSNPERLGSQQGTFRRRDRETAEESEYAVSTISISFAPDGRTVASTHGDHTVKISCCHTGALIRSLEGHPRTPWTVKYHPTKSNIVASGCLGHQVRIWDWNHPIQTYNSGDGDGDENLYWEDGESDAKYNYHARKGVCLKMIRLRNSIISLSFHPSGSILAIACGHTLHLWVYDNESNSSNTTNEQEQIEEDASGTSATNAGDSASASARTNADNGSVGATASSGLAPEGPGFNENGQSGQTVLHQIRYANNLRCVHFPPGGDTIIIGGVNPNSDETQTSETSYSLLLLDFDLNVALMSPTEFNYFQSIDPDDRRSRPPVEVLHNYRTFLPRALLYNDGGFDISEDGNKLCGCANLWLPFGVNSAAELIEREENEKVALMERSFAPTKREKKKLRSMDVDDNGNDTYNSPPRQSALPPVGNCMTPPNPSRPEPTSPPSPPGRRWISRLDGGGYGHGKGNGKGASSGASTPLNTSRLQPTGGRYVPHVVVVSLDAKVNALGESTLGKVIEATPLQSRAASVTCVKFSPSAEFCLLGYGVRETGQSLPYHPVNSLYRVNGGMAQVASMLSRDDDVNIARFHPQSGVGFVYGTKQGRVRVLAPRPWNYYYD